MGHLLSMGIGMQKSSSFPAYGTFAFSTCEYYGPASAYYTANYYNDGLGGYYRVQTFTPC